MSADQYLVERVDQFQSWYDGKAVIHKRLFQRLRTISVVGAVIVPVVANSFPEHPSATRWLTTAISLIVSVSVALDSAFHFGDQWKNYRSTEQFLSREKFLFRTGNGSYKGKPPDEAFEILVDRCENQIAAENSATLNVISTAAEQAQPAVAKTH
jgi:Protein of unknown function (DUF4231)